MSKNDVKTDANAAAPTPTERMEVALRTLEGFIKSGGKVKLTAEATKALQAESLPKELVEAEKKELETLRTENAWLKDRHAQARTRLESIIHKVETLTGENA